MDRVALILTVVATVVGSSACEDAFQPFQTGRPLHHSVFGYLNVSADTQWIRVTPIRQSVFTEPGLLDAVVTLEHMETGVVTLLRDSVFRFGSTLPGEGAESFVHNFWTDVPIEPESSYRLTVTSDADTTTTMVPIPRTLPEVAVRTTLVRGGPPLFVTTLQDHLVVEIDHLAMVRVVHHISDRTPAQLMGIYGDCALPVSAPRVHSLRQPLNPVDTVGTAVELQISRTLNPNLLRNDPPERSCVVGRREVVVAGSGSAWPTGVLFSPSAPLAEVPSDIDGGVGFVGGVVTRTVPFEDCTRRPQSIGTSCVMRYDAQSVTLEGTVTDSVCLWPVEGATVELEQQDDSGAPLVVRTTLTDQEGAYVIGALLPGRDYVMRVSHPARWPPNDPFAAQKVYYNDHEDTLAFGPGETVTYDVSLIRWVPCSPD